VVDNDGIHGMIERCATRELVISEYVCCQPIVHPLDPLCSFRLCFLTPLFSLQDIIVDYFEYSGGHGLQVFWSGPNVTKEIIPVQMSRCVTRTSSGATLSTLDAAGVPLQTQLAVLSPEIMYSRVVSSASPPVNPSTAQMSVTVYGANGGLFDWSGRVRIAQSACASSRWRSNTLITCRTASSVGTGLSITASVLLNHGVLLRVFSFSGSVSVSSVDAVLPFSGSFQVTINGMNFGSFNPSLSSRMGETACEISFWRSSSGIVGKVSGYFNRVTSIVGILSVEKFKSSFLKPSSLQWFRDASVGNSKSSNTPSTGGANVAIIGLQLGSHWFSAIHRFIGSACKFTRWLSDTCIQIRVIHGVVTSNSTLFISSPGQTAPVIGRLFSALSYDTPSPHVVTSQRLDSINVSGANFGSYLGVIPRTTRCTNITILQKDSSNFVCNSSELNIRDAGIALTEASVSITLIGTVRLDDVTISLWSPQQKEFVLMRNKCYGTLPCSTANSVTFNFQILPVSQSVPNVPVMLCPSSGLYAPESADAVLLRTTLMSQNAIGNWSLRVTAGAQNQNVSSVTLYFKTAILDFKIGNLSATNLAWFSDSSVTMKAPGYQEMQEASSSGWGRNHTLIGLMAGLKSTSSCLYSYPDPVLTTIYGAAEYVSSGNSFVQLVGRYHSNINPSPLARMGLSGCARTRWHSDTALSCFNSPSLGAVRNFELSVDKSAIARFISTLGIFSTPTATNNGDMAAASSAASYVSLAGTGFGVWDSSARARMRCMSSVDATSWQSDTRISCKSQTAVEHRPGVVISIDAVASNISTFLAPHTLFKILACNSSNPRPSTSSNHQAAIASTGSTSVVLHGIGMGAVADRSHRVNFFPTTAQCSEWFSDSIVVSKSPWGYRAHHADLIVSMDLSKSNGTSMYNIQPFNARTLLFLNESTTALIMMMNGSSFSPGFQLPVLVKVDGHPVVTNWTSDSSISCVYKWPVSRDVLNLFVNFFDLSSNNVLLSASVLYNPVFIPSSKLIVDSLNIIVYISVPADVASNLNEFILRGSAIGWTFPTQVFSSAPSFYELELIDIDMVAYNNHTQVYLKDYAPVGVQLYGSLSLYDSSQTSMNHLVCFGNSSLSISASLPPNAFATVFRASFAICSLPKDVESFTMTAIVAVQVLDERGALISLSTQPTSLFIRARPQARLIAQFNYSNVSAGIVGPESKIVSLVTDGASCSLLTFEYTANVSCLFDQRMVPVLFFPHSLCNNDRGVSTLRNVIQRTCDINLQAWSFGMAGSCQILLEVPSLATSSIIPIVVSPGQPHDASIIGRLPSYIAPGGIIWSNNASDFKCLELSFTDVCNNKIITGGFTCKLSAVLSNLSLYVLHGPGNNIVDSDVNGRCIWCSSRMSVIVPHLIQLQVQWLETQKLLQPFVNVSGPSEASAISLTTPSYVNQTTAGALLPAVTFKLFDANGIAATGGNAVIRVRIVQKKRSTPVGALR
jgi:hypothetical protein